MAYKYWLGSPTSEDWSVPTNWSPAVVPVTGDFDIDETGMMSANGLTISQQILWLSYQGTGSVGLDLENSSIGPGSTLYLNAGTSLISVELNNGNLYGLAYALSGVNVMSVDAGTFTSNVGNLAAWGPPGDTLAINSYGSFSNNGTMYAGAGAVLALELASPTASTTAQQTAYNSGTIEAFSGSTVVIQSAIYGNQSSGTLVNMGQIVAIGGTVELKTDVLNAPHAKVFGSLTIEGGGTILDESGIGNSTITIQSGMLDLGPKFIYGPGPLSAGRLNAGVDFTGTSGTIAFNTPGITEAFQQATNEVMVMAPWEGTTVDICTIHLGTARVYSAQMFSVQGENLVFHASTNA